MILSVDQAIKSWTEEQFMALADDSHRYELVDGELVIMSNSGLEHGEIGSFLGGSLAIYVRPRKLGGVFDSSTGFRMKSGNVRSPQYPSLPKSGCRA